MIKIELIYLITLPKLARVAGGEIEMRVLPDMTRFFPILLKCLVAKSQLYRNFRPSFAEKLLIAG
jgi:hypothetical protein